MLRQAQHALSVVVNLDRLETFGTPSIVVVENWLEELKRLVPTGK